MSDRELVLRPGGLTRYGLVLVSLVFVALGVWMVRSGEALGWLCVVFFGLCLVVAVLNALPGAAELRLGADGFRMRSLFRTQAWQWDEVGDFSVVRVGSAVMIGFTLTDVGRARRPRPRWRMAGVDAALPDSYGQQPDELCRLLADWRDGNLRKPSAASRFTVRAAVKDEIAHGPGGLVLLKIAILVAFCGGPLLVLDELKPALGGRSSFWVVLPPILLLVYGAFALRDRERGGLARASLIGGKIGAALVLLANMYAIGRLLGGYSSADAPLIMVGIAVGTPAALVYWKLASRS